MACCVLPSEFRCFRHILHIYVRNLPISTRTEETGAQGGSGDVLEADRGCVSSYFLISSGPNTATTKVPVTTEAISAGDNRHVYMSEVQRCTQHPVWHQIPNSVRQQFAGLTKFVFSLYCCTTHPKDSVPAPDTDLLLYEMLVEMSHVQYVAPSMTTADELSRLPCHVDHGTHSFVVLLRCFDGVFFPLHPGMQAELGDTEKPQAPWYKVSPPTAEKVSGLIAVPHSEFRGGVPLRRTSGLKNVSIGDLKACSTGTLAWVYLSDFSAARSEAQRTLVAGADKCTGSCRRNVASAQRAVLETRLVSVRERQWRELHSLKKLRDEYDGERRVVSSVTAQLQEANQGIEEKMAKQKESMSRLQEQEGKRAMFLAQLDRVRHHRVAELRELFPIVVCDTSPHTTCCTSVFSICGFRLPMPDQSTGVTLELLHEWSVSLGCAAHLVVALSNLYGCTLPHPLLLCGGRSYVLRLPVLSTETLFSPTSGTHGDVRLPLHCIRHSDRPAMDAAVSLLLLDVAAVAREVGQAATAARATEAAETVAGIRFLGGILRDLLSYPASQKGAME